MHTNTVSSIKSLNNPLSGLLSATKFLTQTPQESSIEQISEGLNMMLNGLALVLDASETILNEKIDLIMDREESILDDETYKDFEEFEKLIDMLQPLVFESEDAGLPDDFRRSIARVIERGRMLKTLERQFRPQSSIPSNIKSFPSLQEENKSEPKKFKGGWTEA